MKKARSIVLYATLIVTSLLLTELSFASVDPATLVGMWLFDEGSGVVAADLSGKGNSGEVKGGATWAVGKFGGALQLNGVDGYVDVPHSDILNIVDAVTIVAWINPSGDNAVNYNAILQRQQASAKNVDSYFFGFNASNKLHFGTYGGNTQTAQNVWNNGQWYHVAAVYSADASTGPLFVDGVEVELSNNKVDAMAGGTNELHIGRYNDIYLNGAIDEIAIFNAVLTQDDIKDIMNLGLGSVTGLTAVSSEDKLTATWGEIKR